jgi:hypothetical protein
MSIQSLANAPDDRIHDDAEIVRRYLETSMIPDPEGAGIRRDLHRWARFRPSARSHGV